MSAKKSKVFFAKNLVFVRGCCENAFHNDIVPISVSFSFFRKTCESSKVLCLSAKIGVRPCTQRVTSLVQMTTKKTRKSTQNRVKIDKNRSPDLFGPPFWRTFGRNSRKNWKNSIKIRTNLAKLSKAVQNPSKLDQFWTQKTVLYQKTPWQGPSLVREFRSRFDLNG